MPNWGNKELPDAPYYNEAMAEQWPTSNGKLSCQPHILYILSNCAGLKLWTLQMAADLGFWSGFKAEGRNQTNS
jgi:hypothetical protein